MIKPKSNPSKTLLTIVAGFLVIYLFTKVKLFLTLTLVLALIGVFSDYLSQKVEFLWLKLSWVLSLIVPNILLSLVFYLFLFPIALLSKLFGQNDPLLLKNNKSSTYKDREEPVFKKESFEKMW